MGKAAGPLGKGAERPGKAAERSGKAAESLGKGAEAAVAGSAAAKPAPCVHSVNRPTKSHQVDCKIDVTACLGQRVPALHVRLPGSLTYLSDLVLVGHGGPP